MTLTREDILISRIVDGSAEPADWGELHALAEHEPEVLRRLADAQRREAALRDAFAEALGVADAVELPEAHSETVFRFRSRLQAWTGWAAAAAVGLAWLTASGVLGPAPEGRQVAGPRWGGPGSADEAFEQYQLLGLAEGRVLAELPKVLISTQRLENGTAEVTYLRRVLERRLVTDVLEPGVDSSGRPTLVPANLTGPAASQDNVF